MNGGSKFGLTAIFFFWTKRQPGLLFISIRRWYKMYKETVKKKKLEKIAELARLERLNKAYS
jgi:hypothetical protein